MKIGVNNLVPHRKNISFKAQDVDNEWWMKGAKRRTERALLGADARMTEVVQQYNISPAGMPYIEEKKDGTKLLHSTIIPGVVTPITQDWRGNHLPEYNY